MLIVAIKRTHQTASPDVVGGSDTSNKREDLWLVLYYQYTDIPMKTNGLTLLGAVLMYCGFAASDADADMMAFFLLLAGALLLISAVRESEKSNEQEAKQHRFSESVYEAEKQDWEEHYNEQ